MSFAVDNEWGDDDSLHGSDIPRENVYVDIWRGGDKWRGKGWVIAQSRFLASIVLQQFEEDSWLFLFDDDAFVNAPEVDKLISSVDPSEPAVYGKMTCALACGGAGILISPSMLKVLREVRVCEELKTTVVVTDSLISSQARFTDNSQEGLGKSFCTVTLTLCTPTPLTICGFGCCYYFLQNKQILEDLPPRMVYDKHLSSVIKKLNLGTLKHDDRFSSQPPTAYGSLKKQPAISFHYIGETHKKPLLCPGCPEQYWTLFLDYYVGDNQQYFSTMNKVMDWVGVDEEQISPEGDNPRTAAVANTVAENLSKKKCTGLDCEMAQWTEWAAVIDKNSNEGSLK